jgi:16S rRNA (cytosine1402-N4)-methyltransferase
VSTFKHTPVLGRELLEGLGVRPGGRWLDATLGGGGHAEGILEATSPDGFLWGCDRDGAAVEAAGRRLGRFEGRHDLRRMNFADVGEWLGHGTLDGACMDLGVSSHQLDTPGRGFSLQADGPLDMRMDTRGGPTAADVVNGWEEGDLARVFRELGDEKDAGRIARRIVRERAVRPFATTLQLAGVIAAAAPRPWQRTHPATQCFQALRMVVNAEVESLGRGLEGVWRVLARGGRLAVITFHSGEDRVVKRFFRERAMEYRVPEGQPDVPELREPCRARARLVSRKPVRACEAEVLANPRSRSAQLRVAEKLED